MSELTSQTNSYARDSALSTAPTSQQTSFLQTPKPAIPKRLILCCDGTWMDSLGKGRYVTSNPRKDPRSPMVASSPPPT